MHMIVVLPCPSPISRIIESKALIQRLHCDANGLEIAGIQKILLLLLLLGDHEGVALAYGIVEDQGVFLREVVLDAQAGWEWLEEGVALAECLLLSSLTGLDGLAIMALFGSVFAAPAGSPRPALP